MKFQKKQREGKLYYYIEEHRAEVFSKIINNETLEEKLKFVDEFLESTHSKIKKHTRKRILLDFSKSDEQIAEYYRQQYPKGGSRKNAGRKQGSLQTTPKTNRTERFTMAITMAEKEFLKQQLHKYRNNQI